MGAGINILTADSKERFPFPREVRFNRSVHSAVPTLMNGWEDDFRIGKVGKTHLFFVGMICPSARMTAGWMERKHCLRYQHSCWVAIDLVDYRK